MTATDVPNRIWLRRTPVRDALGVPWLTLRILGRHWPVLCALSFATFGARRALQDLAVNGSGRNTLLGLLLFILVPVATLTGLAAMVWVIRSSLPSVGAILDTHRREGRLPRLLDRIGGVLIPFLVVYSAYGYLQDDKSQYLYATIWVHATPSSGIPDHLTWTTVLVMAVAVGLRAFLGRWPWARKHGWIGFIRAYLEVAWMAIGAMFVAPIWDKGWAWLTERRFVHWIETAVHHIERLGAPAQHAIGAFDTAFGHINTVILVPIAWISVGAIIYGGTVNRSRSPLLTVRSGGRILKGVGAVKAVVEPAKSVRDRFGPLVDALRLLGATGLIPMLVFCLIFLVVQETATWLFLGEKAVIGARDLGSFWMPVSYLLSDVNQAIRNVLLVCLMGAAIDRVIRFEPEAADGGEGDGAGGALIAFEALGDVLEQVFDGVPDDEPVVGVATPAASTGPTVMDPQAEPTDAAGSTSVSRRAGPALDYLGATVPRVRITGGSVATAETAEIPATTAVPPIDEPTAPRPLVPSRLAVPRQRDPRTPPQ